MEALVASSSEAFLVESSKGEVNEAVSGGGVVGVSVSSGWFGRLRYSVAVERILPIRARARRIGLSRHPDKLQA